ncbi:MAG: OST-HTH/LOTUS domain-containing protein [Pseudomonadales bacterium]
MRALSAPTKDTEQTSRPTEFPIKFVLEALEHSSDESGWAHLGTFGSYLTKLQPDFDSRRFGFKKLSDLVRAKTDVFATEERALPGQEQKSLYVRAKSALNNSFKPMPLRGRHGVVRSRYRRFVPRVTATQALALTRAGLSAIRQCRILDLCIPLLRSRPLSPMPTKSGRQRSAGRFVPGWRPILKPEM